MSVSNPVEHLFVCAGTKEACPVNVYDPATGACLWSYKGVELQGEAPGQAIIVADQYVYITVQGRPVIVHASMQSKNRIHFRSFIPGPVQCLAVTREGTVFSGAIGEKIYTWMVSNGALTSTVSGHYQSIVRLRYTSDGSFLISAGKDGRLLAWNMIDLLAPENPLFKKPSAAKCLSAHSLPITDTKVGIGGGNCRIYSVSLDQSAKIYSLASGRLLMTLIFDCALTSCAVDDAESRLFIGTIKGLILQVNLFMQPVARERHVQTLVESSEYPVFRGHEQRIVELAVNSDSTLLASGSEDGTVRLWHTSSRQCLRTIPCNGCVTSIQFTISLPAVADRDYVCTHPVHAFQKQLRPVDSQGMTIMKMRKVDLENDLALPSEEDLEKMMEQLRNEEEITKEVMGSCPLNPESLLDESDSDEWTPKKTIVRVGEPSARRARKSLRRIAK